MTQEETGFELTSVDDLGWSFRFHFLLDGEELAITPPNREWPEKWDYNNSLDRVSINGVPPRHNALTVSDLERVIRAVEGHIAYCYYHGFGPTNGGPMHFREEVWKWRPIVARLRQLWTPPTEPRPVRPYFTGKGIFNCCGEHCEGLPHAA